MLKISFAILQFLTDKNRQNQQTSI